MKDLKELSFKLDIVILIGFIENKDDKVYISHLIIEGKKLRIYRKTHLGECEKDFLQRGMT